MPIGWSWLTRGGNSPLLDLSPSRIVDGTRAQAVPTVALFFSFKASRLVLRVWI